jgi:hypothetical protein
MPAPPHENVVIVARGSCGLLCSDAGAPAGDHGAPRAAVPRCWHLVEADPSLAPSLPWHKQPPVRRQAPLAAITVTQNGWWPCKDRVGGGAAAGPSNGCSDTPSGALTSSSCGSSERGRPWWRRRTVPEEGRRQQQPVNCWSQQQQQQPQQQHPQQQLRRPKQRQRAQHDQEQSQHWQRPAKQKQRHKQQPQQQGSPPAATALASSALAMDALSPRAPKALHTVVLEHLEHGKLLVAGAMSAVVSRTAVAPLERVRSPRGFAGAAAGGGPPGSSRICMVVSANVRLMQG